MTESTLDDHDPDNREIPEGWTAPALGNVAKWGSGGTPKSGTSSYYGGPIPWVVISDLNEGLITKTAQSITEEGLKASSAKLIEAGTILLAMYGSIGKTGIAGRQMATNQAIAFAVPDHSIIGSEFLHLYLQSQREPFLAAGKGGTQSNISQTIIKSWPVPIPPLEEQAQIVEILEEQLSRLDAALDSVRVIREKAAQFRRSLLHAAFIGTLTGHRPRNDEVPGDWIRLPLGTVADVGWGDLQTTKASYVDEGFLAFSATGPDGFLPTYDYDQTGIVLSAIGAACGKTWLASGTWSCIKNTMRILPADDAVDIRFLHQQLSDPHMWPKRGTGQPFIAQKDARDLLVALPPLPEQERIVEILEEQLSRLDAALAVADRIEKRSSALRRSLLHAAFTGRLTERWREHAHV